MKYILILLFLLSRGIYSQSFRLGFDVEAQQVRVNHDILGGEGAPLAYHLNFAYSPDENFSLLVSAGRTLHINFGGWEFGAAARYNFYSPFYTSAGILNHSNEGGSGSNTWETSYASILLLNAAVGIEVSSVASIQLGYYYPTSKKAVGYAWPNDHNKPYALNLTGMVRLTFLFSWKL